jgi:hypothetical protein
MDHEEHLPPLVEGPEEGAEQGELPLVGDVVPTEPQPDNPEAAPSAEHRPGLPPIPD